MELNASMRTHQYTSLQCIQQWSGHGHESPFDTIFVYQKFADNTLEVPLPWTVVDEGVAVNFPISLELRPLSEGDQILFQLTFQEDLLPSDQADLLLQQLDFTFLDILSNPESSCNDFSGFAPDLLSVRLAKEPAIPSASHLLHQFVEIHACATPHKVALEFVTSFSNGTVNKRQWTYSELDAESNKVASLLLGSGLLPGDLVAISFRKCPEASFAILGILKAGCAYVALDPDAPVARKHFIIEDSGAKLLLTLEEQTAEVQDNMLIPIITLNTKGVFDGLSDEAPSLTRPTQPGDVCYCLYTSGTTGTPKGCDITHENAVQAILAFQRTFFGRWDAESRWLQFASYHFDVSVLEQFWSWSVGICVTSAPRDLILEDISEVIRQLRITHLDLTPSLARTLHPDYVPLLCGGVFITGGELLKQDILDEWGPKACIYNAYGPTEATIGVTVFPQMPANGRSSNIGTQFDNVGTYVLQPGSSRPVLRGAVGELCVSGKLVGRGYRNRPELTNKRFQTLERYNERIYRTGDLVRMLHDGSFDFLGRGDDQVKIRGQRLEVMEINEVVKEVKQVSEVATLVIKHPRQQKEQLVSFVVLGDGLHNRLPASIEFNPKDPAVIISIQRACRAKLPIYGVPTHIIPLTSLPLSANHKADVNKLKDIYTNASLNELQNLSSCRSSHSNKWTSRERQLVTALADFLRAETRDITRDSNVFELGLDSISVTGLARVLRENGFTNSKPSLIMRNGMVGDLLKALQEEQRVTSSLVHSQSAAKRMTLIFQQKHSFEICRALGVKFDSVESIAPCTPLQQGMIATSLKSKGSLYFNAFYFEMSPETSLERLRKAWEKVHKQCQILRTIFFPTEDGFAQVSVKSATPSWRILSALSDKEVEKIKKIQYEDWCRHNSQTVTKPFEVVVIQGISTTVMCVHIFHALYDGNSLQMTLQRLSQEYKDETQIDYGLSFQEILSLGPLCEPVGAEDFWLEHMRHASPVRMPSLTDNSSRGDNEALLDIENMTGFEEVRRKLNTTHQSLIQACWLSVLKPYFKNGVTIGVVVSGRATDIDGADKVIGPLFNTIPFFLDYESSETWIDIVRKCHAFSIDSLPYQQVPLRDITKWCKRSTDQPLFDTLFVFDKELEQPSTTSPDLWRLVESRSEADFQLSFEAQLQLDGRLKLKILAQNSTSDERSSTSLLEKFVEKLRHLIKNPEGRLDSGTDHEEQGTLPANATATSYPQPFSDVDGTQEDFAWTEKAYLILEEVAALACLEASEISAHISILQLGLDSIDAAKLASRLKRRGLMLGISTIMRTLTIANMAEYLPEETDVKVFGASCMKLDEYERVLRDHLNGIHVELGDVEAVLPATAFQEAMIANMIKSQQTTYFNHDVLQITTDVDFDKLMDAWETVVASTPILRTSFMEIDHPDIPVAYVQVVHRFRKITWEIIQLPDEATLQDTFKQSTMQDVRESLEQPPFSLNIYEYKKKHYMILSIAHMLYDGWCLHLLHQDVRRVYHGSYVPRPSYVPVLERILQATDEAAKDFWKSQLKGVEGTVFPRSKFQTEHETQRHVHREYISSVSAQSVRTFCKAQNITLQALGYTCWTFILASYTQKLDVVFGAVFSGRDSEEEEEVFFPTMSTVAVRSTIHGSRRDMLRYMYDINRSIAQFQHYPLRMAQRFAEHQAHELFNTLFIIQKRPEEINDQGEGLYQSVDGASSTEYPLCVELEVVGDDVIWRATSEESTLDHEGMQRFLHEIDSIADAIIKNPDGPSFDLTEGGISICGLRSFTPSPISGSKTTNSSETKESSDLDPEWIDVEKSIRKVLSLVSKVPEDQIQKSQTIFHLGLDSISAIKVSSLLRRQSIRLSVSQLLKAATISNMAAVHARSQVDLDEDSKTDTQSVLRKEMEGFDINSLCIGAGIDPARVEKMIPATAGQVCFLSIWQNTRGTLFHSTFEYKCQGLLDKTRLDEAWRSLLTQSPILRSTFVATDQRRLPILQVMLKDYRPGAVRGREEGGLPLVNLRVQHDSGGTLLQLEILHALYDAISLPLIISYLQMFYHNPEAQITPQPQLDDFLALTLSGSDQPKRKEFWKTYLGSPTKLQNRSFRESKSDAVTRTEVFQPALLPKASHLERTARLHGVTIQSLFLAAYAKAFAAFLPRYEDTSSGQIDVIFGIYLVNRSHPLEGLPKLAAPTVNIVPLKVTISPPSKSLIAMAMQIQEDLQLISNLQNSAVSLWEIDEWTGIKLNSTVNFLRLLDSDDYDDHGSEQDRIAATVDDKDKSSGMVHCDGDDKEKEKEKQQFHPVLPPEWNSGIVLRRQTTTTSQEGQTAFVEPIALATNLVRDSYLPSVDIEARIQNDALQVGIFGSADLIALDEADGLLRVIREELCAVVGVDGVGVGDEDGE
ncbi:MAG: NRPS [Peltula sp. TS41687]|nr:MAG: NRPS [Peltula sp. TS41687]